MSLLGIIKNLNDSINIKDKELSSKLIQERKFTNLYELIDSNIYKLNKKKKKDRTEEESNNLDKLRELRMYLTSYLDQLDEGDVYINTIRNEEYL